MQEIETGAENFQEQEREQKKLEKVSGKDKKGQKTCIENETTRKLSKSWRKKNGSGTAKIEKSFENTTNFESTRILKLYQNRSKSNTKQSKITKNSSKKLKFVFFKTFFSKISQFESNSAVKFMIIWQFTQFTLEIWKKIRFKLEISQFSLKTR